LGAANFGAIERGGQAMGLISASDIAAATNQNNI
jgi:hypothetical protein